MLTNEQHEFLNSLLSRARMKVANSPRRFISNASNTQDIRSGAGPDERDPATLGGSIDKFIVNKGWDLQVATGRIQAQWEAIVGSTLAQHVHIETFDLSGKQPRMVLRADSTAWATQVRLMTQRSWPRTTRYVRLKQTNFRPDLWGFLTRFQAVDKGLFGCTK